MPARSQNLVQLVLPNSHFCLKIGKTSSFSAALICGMYKLMTSFNPLSPYRKLAGGNENGIIIGAKCPTWKVKIFSKPPKYKNQIGIGKNVKKHKLEENLFHKLAKRVEPKVEQNMSCGISLYQPTELYQTQLGSNWLVLLISWWEWRKKLVTYGTLPQKWYQSRSFWLGSAELQSLNLVSLQVVI